MSADDYDPRQTARRDVHFDPAEAAIVHATIYVGDQLARIAAAVERVADDIRLRTEGGF